MNRWRCLLSPPDLKTAEKESTLATVDRVQVLGNVTELRPLYSTLGGCRNGIASPHTRKTQGTGTGHHGNKQWIASGITHYGDPHKVHPTDVCVVVLQPLQVELKKSPLWLGCISYFGNEEIQAGAQKLWSRTQTA